MGPTEPDEAAAGAVAGPLPSSEIPTHHLPALDAQRPPVGPQAPSAPGAAQLPAAGSCGSFSHHAHADHDPSHVWIPELIDRIAACLPNPNQVPLCFRLVNRAAAAHLRRPRDLTVRLSLPAPHTEFAWRFGGAGSSAGVGAGNATSGQGNERGGAGGSGGSYSCGRLPAPPHTTSWQLRQLLPLTARSGAVENLQVAAAALRAAFATSSPQLPQPPVVVTAAAATAVVAAGRDRREAGAPEAAAAAAAAAATAAAAAAATPIAAEAGVRPAVVGAPAAPSAGDQIVAEAGSAAIAAAAGAGHAAAAAWLVREGGFAATKTALERAARAGDEAMCRWLLGPEGRCPWTFAAPVAALRAGHARLGEWLMRRRPCGAGAGTSSGGPSCGPLTSLPLASSGAAVAAATPADGGGAGCSSSDSPGGGSSGGGGGGLAGANGAAGADDGDDGPAPQRPGQVLGGRRTWLDAVMTAAARGCSLEQLAGLHERWLDSRGATIDGPGRNLVLAAAAGSATSDWADKVAWLAGEGYWSGTPAAAEAAAAPGGRARLDWLEARGYVVGEDSVEAAARAGQLELLSYLLTERRLRLGPAGAAAALNGAVGAGQLAAAQLLVSAGGCRTQEAQLLRAAAGGDVQMVTWLLNAVGHRLFSTKISGSDADASTDISTHVAAPGVGAEPTPVALAAAAAAAPAAVVLGPGDPISADEVLRVAAGSEASAGSTEVLQALWDWSWSDGGSGRGDGGGRGEAGASSSATTTEAAPAVAAEGEPAVSRAGAYDSGSVSSGGGSGRALDGGRAALRRAWHDPALFAAAAAAGSEEKAAWLAAHGCGMPADGGPYVHAALAGDLPMLRRLQQLGCSLGPEATHTALRQ